MKSNVESRANFKAAICFRKYIDSIELRAASNAKHSAQLQYGACQYNNCTQHAARSRVSSCQVIELSKEQRGRAYR